MRARWLAVAAAAAAGGCKTLDRETDIIIRDLKHSMKSVFDNEGPIQPEKQKPGDPPPPSQKDIDDAKVHYRAGKLHYDNGKHKEAVEEFEESYRLSRRADLLYNLALCYEKLGRKKDAAARLRTYLERKPNADDRAEVESWIKQLESGAA